MLSGDDSNLALSLSVLSGQVSLRTLKSTELVIKSNTTYSLFLNDWVLTALRLTTLVVSAVLCRLTCTRLLKFKLLCTLYSHLYLSLHLIPPLFPLCLLLILSLLTIFTVSPSHLVLCVSWLITNSWLLSYLIGLCLPICTSVLFSLSWYSTSLICYSCPFVCFWSILIHIKCPSINTYDKIPILWSLV